MEYHRRLAILYGALSLAFWIVVMFPRFLMGRYTPWFSSYTAAIGMMGFFTGYFYMRSRESLKKAYPGRKL